MGINIPRLAYEYIKSVPNVGHLSRKNINPPDDVPSIYHTLFKDTVMELLQES